MPKVPHLKGAPPKAKYRHMQEVMQRKADLAEHQRTYTAPICANPTCAKPITGLPFFLVGKTDLCFGCYEDLRDRSQRISAYDR